MISLHDEPMFHETNGVATFTLNQTAKLLKLDKGRLKLMQVLRDEKVILKDNSPSQEMIDKGYMVYKLKNVTRGKKEPLKAVPVALVTIEGLSYLKQVLTTKHFFEEPLRTFKNLILHTAEVTAGNRLAFNPRMSEEDLLREVKEQIEPIFDGIRNEIKDCVSDLHSEHEEYLNSGENEN